MQHRSATMPHNQIVITRGEIVKFTPHTRLNNAGLRWSNMVIVNILANIVARAP